MQFHIRDVLPGHYIWCQTPPPEVHNIIDFKLI